MFAEHVPIPSRAEKNAYLGMGSSLSERRVWVSMRRPWQRNPVGRALGYLSLRRRCNDRKISISRRVFYADFAMQIKLLKTIYLIK